MISVATCVTLAYAICSIQYNGKEFINNYDHGRQLQSAVVYDDMEEANNPTEAGSYADAWWQNPSSSVIISAASTATSLDTYSYPAYWYPVAGQVVSNTLFQKHVTLGAVGGSLPNVLKYKVGFTVPAGKQHAQFEALTAYMPAEFSKFLTINTTTGNLALLSDGPGEQNLPVILSTPDERYAMSIYTTAPVQPGYGRFRFTADGVVKMNVVYRAWNPTGTYRYNFCVVVGSLEEVRQSIMVLKNNPSECRHLGPMQM